jgi:uncharacterized protein YlzI (FlbEa/FlbD family)
MLIFTDAITENAIAVNPEHIIAVFTSPSGEFEGKTVVSVTNGSIIVKESTTEVLGAIKGGQ